MEDKTLVVARAPRPAALAQVRPLRVGYRAESGQPVTARFTAPFRIGRDPTCQISLHDDGVSREHLEARPAGDHWQLCDLNSLNGSLVGGQPIQEHLLRDAVQVQLGVDGPTLTLEVEPAPGPSRTKDPARPEPGPGPGPEDTQSVTTIFRKVLQGGAADGVAAPDANRLHQHFVAARQREARRTGTAIGVLATLLVVTVLVAAYTQSQWERNKQTAVDLFYAMKDLELRFTALKASLDMSPGSAQSKAATEMEHELRNMQSRYRDLAQKRAPFAWPASEEEQLIHAVARAFGECELDMPDDFLAEIKKYIKEWQKSDRLPRAIRRLHAKNYRDFIQRTLAEHQLPPQFLYVALQESNFKARAVGPATRFGIAKGMWQFIPGTAEEYGLRLGPLVATEVFDPEDDRFDVVRATSAAAAYLKDIYATEAQASGLLVVAAYNMGHNRTRRLVRKMTQSPRERNFWNLLKQARLPAETREYVLLIFAAAVIGENPPMFGFDFANPLETSDHRSSAIDSQPGSPRA